MTRKPKKLDELARRREIKKAPVDLSLQDHEWLRRHGLMRVGVRTYLTDQKLRDAEYGVANHCSIVRNGPELIYVSFKHHKVVKMPNRDVRP